MRIVPALGLAILWVFAASQADGSEPTPADVRAEATEAVLQRPIVDCLNDRANPLELRNAIRKCDEAIRLIKETISMSNGTLTSTSVGRLDEVERAKERLEETAPDIPISEHWSITVPVYTGLVRVQFATEDGQTDQFSAFSGVGTGIKFRRQALTGDNRTIEVLGLGLGLYFEPNVAVSQSDDESEDADAAQTLSALFSVSFVEHFSLGFGWKFASNEPNFERFADDSLFLVIGLGVDGKTLLGGK